MFQLWSYRYHGALHDRPQAPRLPVQQLWLRILGVGEELKDETKAKLFTGILVAVAITTAVIIAYLLGRLAGG